MENPQRMAVALEQAGMQVGQMGRDGKGKWYLYLTGPWAAGGDVFVVAQLVGKPETVECCEAIEIQPQQKPV